MLGAIIGDVVGSVYEFHNIKKKDFPLLQKDSHFTDDTILTCAVAEWLLSDEKPEIFLKRWGNLYKNRTYENGTISAFGKGFTSWLETNEPTQSCANGCIMRLSPVGLFIDDLKQAFQKAEQLTKTTHNHPESLHAAKAYVETIYLVKKHTPVNIIKTYIQNKYAYNLSSSIDEIRQNYNKFYCLCKNCVPQAITCALDATSYEDALRNAVSLGGDSDTMACIAGGIAEARFDIPQTLITKTRPYLDARINALIDKFYQKQREA